MKTLRQVMKESIKSNSGLSTYLCLAKAVRGQNYSRGDILEALLTQVDKSDYLPSMRDTLLDQLCGLSVTPERGQKVFEPQQNQGYFKPQLRN